MLKSTTRRDVLKGGLAVAGLGMLGVPEWALPALAQGETLVPFTDMPGRTSTRRRPPDRRLLDIRTIDGAVHAEGSVLHDAALRPSRRRSGGVPAEGHGPGGPAAVAVARRAHEDGQHRARRRLRVLRQPPSAAGADRQRPLDRRAARRPCSTQPASRPSAREFVFFGADQGEEEVEFRTQKFTRRAAVRPQPAARHGAVARAVPRLRAERRAADEASGRAAAADRARAGTASPT